MGKLWKYPEKSEICIEVKKLTILKHRYMAIYIYIYTCHELQLTSPIKKNSDCIYKPS